MNRNSNYFFIAAFLLISAFPLTAQDSNKGLSTGSGTDPDDSAKVQTIYQCQVHPQVLSNIGGNCPRCELQLKLLSMEEAFANLSKKGLKKPELSPNYLTKTMVEEEIVTADSAEVTDTALASVNLDEYDFETIDHDGDGMLYQCPKDRLEFEDEDGNCIVCGTPYEFLTIDQVKKNLTSIPKTKKPKKEKADSTDSINP